MKYIVIELQKTGDTVSHILTTFDTINEAESHYYSILAAAAISSVSVHSAVIITEEGYPLKRECYKHITG